MKDPYQKLLEIRNYLDKITTEDRKKLDLLDNKVYLGTVEAIEEIVTDIDNYLKQPKPKTKSGRWAFWKNESHKKR